MSRNEGVGETSPWINGWHPSAHQLRSPNFGPRPPGVSLDLIVVHSISLPPGVYGGDGVQRLFTNSLDWEEHPYYQSIRGLEVSAHFYISRNGDLWQFVSCDDRAWHAGVSSHEGRVNCNDYSIGIELEGVEGDTFETQQYARLGELCRALKSRYPIAHIAGHQHVAPDRKSDPGPGFDWRFFQQILAWNPKYFP